MIKRRIAVIGFNMKEVIVIIIITSIVSALVIGTIITNGYRTSTGVSYRELLTDDNVKDILNVYSEVTNDYYKEIDKSKVVDSAIKGMMGYLGDKYSSYIDSSESDELTSKLSGEYEGIGVTIDGSGKIIKVASNTPAEEVGLVKGDIIISVDDIVINEDNSDLISDYIKQLNGTINIKVNRNNNILSFDVNKEIINSPSIATNIYDYNNKKIGYILIKSFTITLGKQIEEELQNDMKDIDSLIIDVRNNGGGYLKATNDVASLFLEKGEIIYTLESKNNKVIYKDETNVKTNYPIVVLINKGSASASEILAAALRESYGALLVGNKSYGKGLVQEVYKLDDGSMAKYSSAKWLTPKGDCVEGMGIIPDYDIDNENNIDNQLNKAIDIISKM